MNWQREPFGIYRRLSLPSETFWHNILANAPANLGTKLAKTRLEFDHQSRQAIRRRT
jgi:hypothetical protein